MFDGKLLVGTMVTASAAASTWIEQVNSYGQLAVTVIGIAVGLLTGWYAWERATKLRYQRRERLRQDVEGTKEK